MIQGAQRKTLTFAPSRKAGEGTDAARWIMTKKMACRDERETNEKSRSVERLSATKTLI
jgi:hypothetical protein